MVMAMGLAACRTHYEVAKVERSRILVDSRYDAHSDTEATLFLQHYSHIVKKYSGGSVSVSGEICYKLVGEGKGTADL